MVRVIISLMSLVVTVCSSVGLSKLAHCNISRAWHSTWQVKEGRKEGRQGGSGGWEKRRKESERECRKEKWENPQRERKGKNSDKNKTRT